MSPQFKKGRTSPWQVQYRETRGSKRGKIVSRSFVRREDALQFEAHINRTRQLIRAGLEAPKEEILFIDYTANWLEKRYAEYPLATVKQDETRLRNYWVPEFGSTALGVITSSDIKQKLDEIQFEQNHSAGDRNRHRALLHKIFQDALMDDRVDYNPVAKIPLKPESRHRRIALTFDEQKLYLDGLTAQGSQYRVLGEILIWTGARVCSGNVLQYQDVDFQLSVVRIRRLEERASKTVVERQKGDGKFSETVVPLFPRLRAILLEWRKHSQFTRQTDYIACQPSGNYIPYDTLKGVHTRVLKAPGLRTFTLHDLRSTFASNAERAGYTKSDIRDMLGHSTVLVTEKYTQKSIEHLVQKGRMIGFGAVENVETIPVERPLC